MDNQTMGNNIIQKIFLIQLVACFNLKQENDQLCSVLQLYRSPLLVFLELYCNFVIVLGALLPSSCAQNYLIS